MAWYLVAARAGVLWTRRALGAGAAVSGLGLLGLRFPWALDVMLAVDVALVALVWLDAALAVRLADVGKGRVRRGSGSSAMHRRHSRWGGEEMCRTGG